MGGADQVIVFLVALACLVGIVWLGLAIVLIVALA